MYRPVRKYLKQPLISITYYGNSTLGRIINVVLHTSSGVRNTTGFPTAKPEDMRRIFLKLFIAFFQRKTKGHYKFQRIVTQIYDYGAYEYCHNVYAKQGHR